jgi:acyl-coenzyme A synthetase/AMP-(fatty) acid ligase/aryl carrier-like protein
VRIVILGGEKASDTARDAWFRKVPGTTSNKVPGTLLMNTYGPTETTVIATSAAVPAAGEIPIGRPLAGVRTHLVDAGLRAVPAGGQGEITIAGAGLARGYLGRPRLTAQRFVPDPFAPHPGARLYKTGDLGRHRRDGSLLFRGRVDHQVKLRGLRVEPGEIAAVLARHPAIDQAEVVYRPLPSGVPGLAAFVVPRGEAPTPDTLRAFLRDSLPPFMVPAAFSLLEELPKTPANKVDRRALGRLPLQLEAATAAEAPQGQLESRLATLWAEVLGLPTLGVTHNFFDLGGDSLLILRLHRRLEEEGFRLQVLDLFRHTTVRTLARHLGATEEQKPDFDSARKLVEQQKKARRRRKRRRPGARG